MFEIKKILNIDYILGLKLEYDIISEYNYKITDKNNNEVIDYKNKIEQQINLGYLKENFYGKEIEVNLEAVGIESNFELPTDKYLKELSTINNKIEILIGKTGEIIKILTFDELRREWESKKIELRNKYFKDDTMLSLIELTDLGYNNDVVFKVNFFNNLVYKLLFFDGYNKVYVTNQIKKGKFEIRNYIKDISLPMANEIYMKEYDLSKNMLKIVMEGKLRERLFDNNKFTERFGFDEKQKLKSKLEIIYHFEITTGYILKCECKLISESQNYFQENKINIIGKGKKDYEWI